MFGNSLFKVYSLIWILLSPLIPIFLLIRLFFKKEDILRLNERIGFPIKKKPKGNLIWINAVSIGEVRSILPLAEELSKRNCFILITSVTITSAEHIKKYLKKNPYLIHQYSPLDHPLSINNFIKHWKPDASIFVESEIWPNMIAKCHLKKIPLVLIQARISNKTFLRWQYIHSLSKYIFKKFTLIITQDLKSKKRFITLGGNNIIENINLKSHSQASKAEEHEEKKLKHATNSRTILLFASIHDEIEEKASITSHCEASKFVDNLLTIIIPRYPKKIDNLISLAKTKNLNFAIRSKNKLPTCKTNVYLADTIGEIGTFFSISDICFMGGSLSNKGGHNLVEPALEKCTIIFGPDVSNHQTISHTLIKAKGAIQINNINELKDCICYLIRHKEKRQKLGLSAFHSMKNIPEPTKEILKKLEPILLTIKGF